MVLPSWVDHDNTIGIGFTARPNIEINNRVKLFIAKFTLISKQLYLKLVRLYFGDWPEIEFTSILNIINNNTTW